MNSNLNNSLYKRFIFSFVTVLAVISSTACFAQNKTDISNTEILPNMPPSQNISQKKCQSPEEIKTLQPSEFKKSALNDAAFEHNLRAVKKLLKQGIDPNERDSFGNTPLLNALSVHILASHTMNPSEDPAIMRDKQKTLRFQPLIVKELLENKADVNSAGFLGAPPLIETVNWVDNSQNSLKILNLLIQYKVDVNLQDDQNFTALMYAAQKGKSETVKFLLAHNARTDLKNCGGETALSIARTKKNDEIVRMLQDAQ